ncbi:ABC transporter ATP-binding protein [Candidatus Pelagibacter sp. HIMB1321]|uniref:ABC transporter ATP-binding protein n=1 Tax=Candidatus Pelagibacter sp. HIMB1321 TaxID=1388755 RepID=UPI000A0803BF|nr:ABC transporter ATP-binding protein [Candidatus Pelagibacter sp. HIMB1321]SMF70591.1 ATP-binding cassette, subfamily B, MsbA [Candidatus Pelagibacter sp. HIMB1321]
MTNIEILKRLYNDYTKKYISKIFLAFLFTIVLAGSTSSIAYLLDPAIKQLFIEQNKTLIFILPGLIVLAFGFKGVSLYFAKVIMIKVGENFRKKIQNDLFSSLINADTQSIDEKHSGEFISNITHDVNTVNGLVTVALLNLFKDSLTLIGLLFVMFYQNWKLALVALIMIPFASLAAKILGKRMGKVTNQLMTTAGDLNSYLIEIFKNHKLTKIFQQEKFEKNKALEKIENYKNKSEKIQIILVRNSPIMEFLTGIMIALLIFISAKLISNGQLEVSNFFSFLAAMMLAYQPVRSLATLHMEIQRGLSGAKRLLPIIDDAPKIRELPEAKILKVDQGKIDFLNVEFYYPKNKTKILKNINLSFPGKKMTALVGLSGAGKSTILNLIPRFYDKTNGDIKIDNQSIFGVTIQSLRNEISLVSQDTTLFDDTIKNNIKYANPEATETEIIKATKYSYANEFIEKLPDQYETIIGENGIRLSGGEKQRISIARALLKKSSIILLDEATSSLDADTEEKIQDAINLLTKGRTTIVIAHRLSTILNSEKIYVINDGLVIGEGKHNDLLLSSSEYKNFYEKQIKR